MTDPVWWFYLTWIPGILQQRLPRESHQHRAAADRDLPHGGCRFHRRRLAVCRNGVAGMDANRSRKMAMLICAAMASAGHVRVLRQVAMARRDSDRSGCCRASGMVCESVYDGVRCISAPRCRLPLSGSADLAGAIGGMIVQPAVGKWLDFSGKSYGPIFCYCGNHVSDRACY